MDDRFLEEETKTRTGGQTGPAALFGEPNIGLVYLENWFHGQGPNLNKVINTILAPATLEIYIDRLIIPYNFFQKKYPFKILVQNHSIKY